MSEQERPLEAHDDNMSDSTSDHDTDTFEDAPDTASVRSLTKRSQPSLTIQPHPSLSIQPASPLESTPVNSGASELQQAFEKIRSRGAAREPEADADTDTVKKVEESEDKATDDDQTNHESDESHESSFEAIDVAAPDIPSLDVDTAKLDVVNLDDSTESAEVPPVPEKDSRDIKNLKSKNLSLSSIASVLPSIPWSPPAASDTSPGKPLPVSPSANLAAFTAPPITRKLTSPFSWLSRGSSKEKETSPPPPTSSVTNTRRNTASSVATLTSNPEMMLGKLDEEGARNGASRNSLKDRFKMIRMREEAGIMSLPEEDDDDSASQPPSSSASAPAEGSGTAIKTTRLSVPILDDQRPLSPLPTSPNPSLAPGTVSGVTAGPSSIADDSVDWDLWQNVIYEGPAAVARTSPEELNKAIATGIPSAIRGVVWQVLAQSNSDGLESVYHELVARGTEKEKEREREKEKERQSASFAGNRDTVASSSSSVHSGDSGSGTPSVAASTAASSAPDLENAAERKKRAKVDAAALQRLEKAIRRDLGTRTSYSKFAAAQGLQEGLFGVCKAYALFDEAVGYAQGMNFLIMPLLFNMPEEEAFCLLVRLMNQYHLRDLFIQDMPGLHKNLYLFERLLEDLEPALYCHLHRRGITSHLYATQWFLTLFSYRFPLQLVLRIYDLILSEGLSAILKFGVVLMQKNATALLGMTDMGQLTTFLKDRLFDVYIDASPSAGSILENGFFGSSSSSLDKEVYRADQFVRDACDVKLTPELIRAYTTEWEEKTRTEREREVELETLRTTNASLTIKVRRLEERVEADDREQAALATELVHTKVSNEELRDENESLRGQVRELKNVIEKQPAELELAWTAERDDLMARNVKVHDENQRVEKEMAELEEELVQTKMRYAELNSQHEALSRKWSDLKRHIA